MGREPIRAPEGSVMSTTDTFLDSVIVRAPLSVLQTMTEAQHERLEVLVRGYNPATVVLTYDMWNRESILFTLYSDGTQHLLSGLIEQDGSAHT